MALQDATVWYDFNGLPAYRDDKGIMVLVPGGEEKPLEDLNKFVHEAYEISKAEFERLKGSATRADEQERVPAGSPEGGQFAGGGGVLTNQQVSAKLASEAHQKRAETEARLASATGNEKKVFAARVAILKELAESHEADQGKYAEAEAIVRGSDHGTGNATPEAVSAAKEHLSTNYAANERRYKLSQTVRGWENSEAERRFRAQQREIQR